MEYLMNKNLKFEKIYAQFNRLLAVITMSLLGTQFASAQLPELTPSATASGNTTTAVFYGGASSDDGQSYELSFPADEPIDVHAQVKVEAGHVNTVGNIYVVIVLGNQYFMRDHTGAYQLWDGTLGGLQAAYFNKTLEAVEDITIVESVPFGPAGVANATLSIFLAYDTVAAPGEFYYSGAPLSFTIEPDNTVAGSYTLFADAISAPIIQTKCIVCHVATGIAADSALVYVSSSQPDYLITNYNKLLDYIDNAPNGAELILTKPQGLAIHGGGVQLDSASAEFAAFANFVTTVESELAGKGSEIQNIFAAVTNTDAEETLRKAAILFAGRVPSAAELAAVSNASDTQLRSAIRDLMDGDGFHDFLTNGANDRLLTRAYAGNIFEIVNRFYYPESAQFYLAPGKRVESGLTSAALAEEPLELVAHVVMNERPYTEVLTADYIMVNPYSAAVYGGNVTFTNPTDTEEWREGRITEYYRCVFCNPNSPDNWSLTTDYPHAGILNSPAFLARFPSTETNRNRARARWAYYFFLGVDIEGLAERTTDQAALSDENNPTLNNPNCTVCHETMDPVAGSFQNYGDDGLYKYRPGGKHSLPGSYTNSPGSGYQNGDTWYSDMLAPGFGTKLAPNSDNSIQWLAQEFVKDGRFGYGTTYFWYPAIMGRNPYPQPENPEDADYQSKLAAYVAEQEMLQTAAENFVSGAAGNGAHNLKDLLVELVMSDQFRAESVTLMTAAQQIELDEVGTGKLLTPEQLDKKLFDVTGFQWSYGKNSALSSIYSLSYGGVDSLGITNRATDLTTLMSTVVTAMANETACPIVSNDFSKPKASRKLFVDVELNTLPTTNQAAIRSNIQYLHKQLLGEDLASNDPEIDATYNLFVAIWNARKAANKGASVSSVSEVCLFENVQTPVQLDSNQTLRSWAAIVNYLMRDYKFIYE